jgi:arsenate reductase
VCHGGEAQCPVFPGLTKRWHWPFEDPAGVDGDHEAQLEKVRAIRDAIKAWLTNPPVESFAHQDYIKN